MQNKQLVFLTVRIIVLIFAFFAVLHTRSKLLNNNKGRRAASPSVSGSDSGMMQTRQGLLHSDSRQGPAEKALQGNKARPQPPLKARRARAVFENPASAKNARGAVDASAVDTKAAADASAAGEAKSKAPASATPQTAPQKAPLF